MTTTSTPLISAAPSYLALFRGPQALSLPEGPAADILDTMNSTIATLDDPRLEGSWSGLRLSADEFLEIDDESNNYELIDGVVILSPSPIPEHQVVTVEILGQIWLYLRDQSVGQGYTGTDIHLGRSSTGGDLVLKPEIVFHRAERAAETKGRLRGGPDLAVEVISRGSRRFDSITKKQEYERFGVCEYWLIDPDRDQMTFYRLDNGRFVEVQPSEDSFASQAVPGFVLDLRRVRDLFRRG